MTHGANQPTAAWEALKAQLLAEGKADLVEALEELIRENRNIETARLLNRISAKTQADKQ